MLDYACGSRFAANKEDQITNSKIHKLLMEYLAFGRFICVHFYVQKTIISLSLRKPFLQAPMPIPVFPTKTNAVKSKLHVITMATIASTCAENLKHTKPRKPLP
jgi:hypothetical protein